MLSMIIATAVIVLFLFLLAWFVKTREEEPGQYEPITLLIILVALSILILVPVATLTDICEPVIDQENETYYYRADNANLTNYTIKDYGYTTYCFNETTSQINETLYQAYSRSYWVILGFIILYFIYRVFMYFRTLFKR